MKPTALWRLAGFFSTGNVALICAERHALDALGGGGVDRHPPRRTVIEQDLGEDAAGRMAHQDRRRVELADDRFEVRDDRGHGQRLDGGGSALSASTSTSNPGTQGRGRGTRGPRSGGSSAPSSGASPRSRG